MSNLLELLQKIVVDKTSPIQNYYKKNISSLNGKIERYDAYLTRPTLCLFSNSNNLCLLMVEAMGNEKPNGVFMKRLGTIKNNVHYQLLFTEDDIDISFMFTNFTPFHLIFQIFLKSGDKVEQINGFNILKPYSRSKLTVNNNTGSTMRLSTKNNTGQTVKSLEK